MNINNFYLYYSVSTTNTKYYIVICAAVDCYRLIMVITRMGGQIATIPFG